MAHGVELAAIGDFAGGTVYGHDWSAGAATACVRALILVQCQTPLDVCPGPVPHALGYFLEVQSGLVGIRGEARVLSFISPHAGKHILNDGHRPRSAAISMPGNAGDLTQVLILKNILRIIGPVPVVVVYQHLSLKSR